LGEEFAGLLAEHVVCYEGVHSFEALVYAVRL
jgi:hypothetical protein